MRISGALLAMLVLMLFGITADGQKLTCNGEIRFMVLQNITRNDREYFYHTTALSVDDCVAKCYANEFCFSAGFQPSDQHASNPCLFSYRSAYGCSYRSLTATYPDNSRQVIAECIKCNGAEVAVSSGPTQAAATTTVHLEVTKPVATTNAAIITSEAPETTGVPQTTAIVTTESSVVTSVSSTNGVEATTAQTVPVATSSVQPVSPPRHCQKEEEIHFQIGRTTKDLAFLSHESVENSIECVHKCFLQPDCEAVGFLPGVYRGVDTPGKATCIFSSQSTDNTVCGRDLGVKSYNDTLGPAVFRCFTCVKSVEENNTAVTDDTNIKGTPQTPAVASVVTQSLSTVAEITTFGFSTVEPTSSAVSNVSETNSNVTGEQKIDLTAATKPVESTAEPTEAISSTAPQQCSASVEFHVKQPDKAKSVSFNTNERVQSASDCAYLCYSHSNCHEAGFVPGNNQTGTSAQCLFSSDNSSECSANNEAKSTTYDGSTPIVLECITCPATLGSTQVTGQPKIDQTAETRVAGESSEAATTASTGGSHCTKGLLFQVKFADPGKKAHFGNNIAVESAAACASLCFARPDCKSAGFLPKDNRSGNPSECFFSSGYEPLCDAESSALVADYEKTTPAFLECFVCGGDGSVNLGTTAAISKPPEGPVATEVIPVKPTGTVAPAPGLYEPCDGVIKFHIRPIADQIPSGVQIDAMTSASDCVTHCYSKPNCHQAIYVPGNLDKNETAVCKTGNLTQPTCSESIPVVTEYNDTIPVILECFVCVPFTATGAPKIDASPSTQYVAATTYVPSVSTRKPNCSGTIRFEVKSVDATKSPSYVENMEVESAQQCAKLCHDRSDCNSAGFIPSKSSDSSKGECIFSVGVTPNCSALAESTTFYNGSTTVTLDCFACDLTASTPATTSESSISNETVATVVQTSTYAGVTDLANCISDQHQFAMRVESHGAEPLIWAPLYVVPANRTNIYELFKKGVLSALNNTPVGQVVVGVEVLELLNPRDQNVNWTTGLIFRFNISTQPNSISDEVLWNQLISAVHSSNNTLGGTDLIVAFPQSEQAPAIASASTIGTLTATFSRPVENATVEATSITSGETTTAVLEIRISHNTDRTECKQTDIRFQQLTSINVKHLEVLRLVVTESPQACAARCYQDLDCELAGYINTDSSQNCILAKNLTVCLPTQIEKDKEKIFNGTLLLYINCAGSDTVLGTSVTPAIAFAIDRPTCKALVEYRMVETTISSKSFVYGSHIAVATAQDCAQICYQNATCLSAGFVPSSGSESAVCLPIIQGRPLCDQKLKTVRSQGSPVILDCFTCPTHISGVIDATPTSVPISPEVSVAATTNVTDNLSSVESTVLGVFFTTSPASLSTEVNATSTAGLPNKTETVNETNTLNVTTSGETESILTTPVVFAFSLNRPSCPDDSFVSFRVQPATSLAKSLPFAESQKVETIQDCAKLCYQADKCSAAGFISPMETQKAVCIFVKEPESSDCQGLVDRVNTTDAQKPVVIDCITCLSTNIEASPATKTGIETTVTNSSIGTTVESSTAGSANLSLRTDLFSPTGATTEFANYVNQTEGNATATLAVSTLFPTDLTNTTGQSWVNGSAPVSSSLHKTPCNNSLVAFRVLDPSTTGKTNDFNDVQNVKSVQDCARLCYDTENCTRAGFVPPVDQSPAQCLLSAGGSLTADCTGNAPSITTLRTTKGVTLDCIICVDNSIDVFPLTKNPPESSNETSITSTPIAVKNETGAESRLTTPLPGITNATEFFLIVNVTTDAVQLAFTTTAAIEFTANETSFNATYVASINSSLAGNDATTLVSPVTSTAIVKNIDLPQTTLEPSVNNSCSGTVNFRVQPTTVEGKNSHFASNPEFLLVEQPVSSAQDCAQLCFLNTNCSKSWFTSPSGFQTASCSLERLHSTLSDAKSDCEVSLIRVSDVNSTGTVVIDCMACSSSSNIDAFSVTKTPWGGSINLNESTSQRIETTSASGNDSVNVPSTPSETLGNTTEHVTTASNFLVSTVSNDTVTESFQPTLAPFFPVTENLTVTSGPVVNASSNETSGVTPGTFVPIPIDSVSTNATVLLRTTTSSLLLSVTGSNGIRTCDGQTVFQSTPLSGSFSGSQSLGVYPTASLAICASTCYSVSDCNSATFSPGSESNKCTLLKESIQCSSEDNISSNYSATQPVSVYCIRCKEASIEGTPDSRASFTKAGLTSFNTTIGEGNVTIPSVQLEGTITSSIDVTLLNSTLENFNPSVSSLNPENFRVCPPGSLSFHVEPITDAAFNEASKFQQVPQASPEICASICYAVSDCSLAVFDPAKGRFGPGKDGLCSLYHKTTSDCSNATLVSTSNYNPQSPLALKITCTSCNVNQSRNIGTSGPDVLPIANNISTSSVSSSGQAGFPTDLNFVTSSPVQNATVTGSTSINISETSLIAPEFLSSATFAPFKRCKGAFKFQVEDVSNGLNTSLAVQKASVASVAECARLCYEQPSNCLYAAFLPPLSESDNGSCVLTSGQSAFCNSSNDAKSSFSANAPVIIKCFTCEVSTPSPLIEVPVSTIEQGNLENVTTAVVKSSPSVGSSAESVGAVNSSVLSQSATFASLDTANTTIFLDTSTLPLLELRTSGSTSVLPNVTVEQSSVTTVASITSEVSSEGSAAGLECNGTIKFQIGLPDSAKSATFYANRDSLSAAECARLCHSSPDCKKAGWLGAQPGQTSGTCLLSTDPSVCQTGVESVSQYLQGSTAGALSLDCIKCESSPSRLLVRNLKGKERSQP